jgi:hypothetical protein
MLLTELFKCRNSALLTNHIHGTESLGADSHSGDQEMPRDLWNLKVLLPCSQVNPIPAEASPHYHTLFFQIRLMEFFLSHPGVSCDFLHSGFPTIIL